MKDLEAARREIQETDRQMADLFQRRMRAVRDVAAYKKEKGLPILDEDQERRVLERNSSYISDQTLMEYYLRFMRETILISREYQGQLIFGKKENI